MPFRHEFKLSGSYTIPWDIQVNAAFQSYAGPDAWDVLEHRPTTTTVYAGRAASARARWAQLVIPNLVTAPGTADDAERRAAGAGKRLLRPA